MSGNLTSLERVIAKNPTSSLFARLADACLRKGEPHRAIEICRQGLRYRPSYVSGHVVLGRSHFAAGMFEEARKAFNKALHLDPNHAVAIWYLGQIDRTMGWDDLALRNFQKARDLDPLSRTLQGAIDEILASISDQVDQKLREEVGEAEQDREGPVGLLPAEEEDGEGVQKACPEERPKTGVGAGEPLPGDSPVVSAADQPGFDPEKTAISRLLQEIRSSGASPGEERPENDGKQAVARPEGERTPEEETPGNGRRAGEQEGLREAGLQTVSADVRPGGQEPANPPSSGLESLSPPDPAPPGRRGKRSGNGEAPDGTEAGTARRGRPGRPPQNGASGGSAQGDLPITTVTLAEIYAGQGLTTQAMAIFEKVLEREPDNARVRERLSALRAQHAENTPR